ncbi:16S rRNA (guanine(527)-N(7))-methyltransferase RsmG [Caldimonas brevitalea]|uniref:Ribosomal RNA small subunit methyltransferase G n=1 Tax=Caldimonas brevitalea TaxID=413882 RepID=A0A0G3BW09_9BURK|nr:16S rRNA (guanine(527)-N(7))-methyltransferase RsmG [Caldimonas brevitalea]AKJ32213.1 16S rRNA methyltransferase [Caldimonas brevitalea]
MPPLLTHELAPTLELGAQQLALALTQETQQQLLRYLDLMGKWNRVYNLTAIRDPREMLSQHLLDSLAVVGPLQEHLRRQAPPTEQPLVLDVGSGAGLPGVVLAICMPTLRVVCVDAVAKKISFLRQVAAELHLPNLDPRHARIEELPPLDADVVTSRAFASLQDMVQWTRRHVARHGVWMAMKGRRPEAEIEAVAREIDVFHVEQLQVPLLDAERCLVWARPTHTNR